MGRHRKCSKSCFRKGNKPWNLGKKQPREKQNSFKVPKAVRLTPELHKKVTSAGVTGVQPVKTLTSLPYRLLRPRMGNTPQEDDSSLKTNSDRATADVYHLFHVGEIEKLFNEAFREHAMTSANCKGDLIMDIEHEQQWGLNWIERLKCTNCNYLSKHRKLYKEVAGAAAKKGRRSSTANTGLQIGLSKCPMGSESFRLLCMSADVPPPSISGMQKAANRVCDKIKDQNVKDMRARRVEMREINKYRGTNLNNVSISTDGMYNNPLCSGVGKTPFQPATQVTYVATENETCDHQILALQTKSKLCSKHSLVDNTSCVNNPDCTADLHMSESIGNEKQLAEECFKDLKKDQLNVEFLTTDADSAAYTALTGMYEAGEMDVCPQTFLDTRHLSASHRKFIKNSKFVVDMMPAGTRQNKQNLANIFSLDCASRCAAEFSAAYSSHAGDLARLKKSLSYTCDAVADCYMGDHTKCRKQSFVCKGGKQNWLIHSKHLDKNFRITHNEINFQNLRKCTDFRLGPKIIDKTQFNLNSQKCEATNKAMRRSLPRDTTFTRNFQGRAHSAVHSVNLKSPAKSLLMLRQGLGCAVTAKSKIDNEISKSHNKVMKAKTYKKSKISKDRRAKKKLELFKLHHCKQNQYSKDMLLKKNAAYLRHEHQRGDHSYTKLATNRKT